MTIIMTGFRIRSSIAKWLTELSIQVYSISIEEQEKRDSKRSNSKRKGRVKNPCSVVQITNEQTSTSNLKGGNKEATVDATLKDFVVNRY